jgi:hypothetical protein
VSWLEVLCELGQASGTGSRKTKSVGLLRLLESAAVQDVDLPRSRGATSWSQRPWLGSARTLRISDGACLDTG